MSKLMLFDTTHVNHEIRVDKPIVTLQSHRGVIRDLGGCLRHPSLAFVLKFEARLSLSQCFFEVWSLLIFLLLLL